ncbi:MAG TPA: hypothetical protein VHX38_22470 [Pseudonocardiaceae bacterium]|nr:hypothetical protein [Pseudonocardiaceae bacterium]
MRTVDDAEKRAADIGSDQRRKRFTDPRLAQTAIDEWIRSWSDAHRVADITWATYDSHIRNHILPRWSGSALGDIQRIAVNSTLALLVWSSEPSQAVAAEDVTRMVAG